NAHARERADGPHDPDDEQREGEDADRDDRLLARCRARGHAVRAEREEHDRGEREVARALVTGSAAAERGARPPIAGTGTLDRPARDGDRGVARGVGSIHACGAATRSTISLITRAPA